MKKIDHERLTELFNVAVDLDPARRSAFLDESCGSQPELRAELESLLKHDASPPGYLSTGASGGHRVRREETMPDRVGPFRLVQRIGVGGMGVVYRGIQDEPIHRVVAVKLIRGGIETSAVVSRFETERQSLALMQHPNIARVIDAGTTDDGRPYFAMEYVDGESITTFCTRERLPLRARLELFTQVCDGVQHAHRNAIIHRDLKPSNILVATQDGTPIPKIIDFGVSKALDERNVTTSDWTVDGQLIGTPDYMSPEQARGSGQNIDTRTDVYSLGVLLYELIVGVTPFSGGNPGGTSSVVEVLRRVIETAPAPPSVRLSELESTAVRTPWGSRGGRLRGELDWIVLKAMDKNPERRYGSAAEFAADVRRHLEGDVVIARPPSRTYRMVKMVRRNRLTVGLLSSLFIVVLGFAIAMAVQSNRLARARDRATAESETSQRVAGAFVRAFDLPDHARTGPVSAAAILKHGTANIRRELHDPQLRARLLHALAKAHLGIGSSHDALLLAEEARNLFVKDSGPHHPDALAAAHTLALAISRTGPHREAEKVFLDTIEASRASYDPDDSRLMGLLLDLGSLYAQEGRIADAVPLLREAYDGLRRSLGPEDHETLVSQSVLGGVLIERDRIRGGDFEEPLALIRDARDLARDVNDPELGVILYNLAAAHQLREEHAEALANLELAVTAGFYGGPNTLQRQPWVGLSNSDRGAELVRRYDLNWGPNRDRLYQAAVDLVRVGEVDRAVPMLVDVVDVARRQEGIESFDTQAAMALLAKLHLTRQEYDRAEPILRELEEITRHQFGEDDYEMGMLRLITVQLDLHRGDLVAATATYKQVQSIMGQAGDRATVAYARACLEAVRGHRENAVAQLRIARDGGFLDISIADHDLAFVSLRGSPEFEAIVAPD